MYVVMIRLLLLCFSCSFLCSISSSWAMSPPPEVGAYVVLDAKTGKILDGKAIHDPLYPASCTKLATLLYILTKTPEVDLTSKVVIPKLAVQTVPSVEKSKGDWNKTPSYVLESDGSSIGLVAGEVVTVQDLLYGMMVSSGNDAANTLAYYWGGRSIDGFVSHMNSFVQDMGAKDTHFCNPHGLHHPNHVSSAYDLALLTKKALEIPLFRKIVKTNMYIKSKTNKQRLPQTWKNTNKLLKNGPYYLKECIGVKTGWHSRAQKCLVAAAENEHRSLILVLLKHPDMTLIFKHAKNMLEGYLRERPVEKELVSQGNLLLTYQVPGSSQAIPVKAMQAPLSIQYFPSEKPEIEAKAIWHKKFPPLSENDEVGVLEIYKDKELVASLPLVPATSVSASLGTRLCQIEDWCITNLGLCGIVIMLSLATAGFVVLSHFRKKRRW